MFFMRQQLVFTLQKHTFQKSLIPFITLHVGVGTFRPVKADLITDHDMHSEFYEVSKDAADKINEASRKISIGTTVTRVLEHVSQNTNGTIESGAGETNIFIYPGYEFQMYRCTFNQFSSPKKHSVYVGLCLSRSKFNAGGI